jgi:hypothetical protein
MRAKYPDAVPIVAADWNLDGRKAWVRKWIGKSWPTYAVVFPAVGTHGRRAIDGWVTTADLEAGPEVLPAKSSDHKAILATFTHTPREVIPMSGYGPADSEAQWFARAFPGSRINPNVIVLHTTETMGWPGYDNAGPAGSSAPHYTALPVIKPGRVDWRQHFSELESSRALRNLPGGVETNTLNCVQVELVGTCDAAHAKTWGGKKAGVDYIYWPDAPEWALGALADFIADLHKRLGVPLTTPKLWLAYGKDDRAPGRVPASYGDSPARMSGAEWSRFTGVCGHQHVPENVHGDPGRFPIDALMAKVDALVDPKPPRLTNVEQGRADVAAGIAKIRKAPPPRVAADALADALEAVLASSEYPTK